MLASVSLTQSHNSIASSDLGILYLISSTLSYDKLSHVHRAFAISLSVAKEPNSYAEAILDPRWQEAMQVEFDALKANNTWIMCPLPPGKVPIWCKWVYKVKLKANGSLKGIKLVWWLKGLHKLGELIFLYLFSCGQVCHSQDFACSCCCFWMAFDTT